MPQRRGDALRKVTLNLFDNDVFVMEKVYGYGWSERLRELLHEHVRKLVGAEDEQ